MSPEQKTVWMFVGAAFQDGHPACEDCSHRRILVDRHPYQEGCVTVTEAECSLGQYASDEATDCPAYREHVEELAAEARP